MIKNDREINALKHELENMSQKYNALENKLAVAHNEQIKKLEANLGFIEE